MKFRRRKARARDNRLEIAGQKSLGLAQTPDAQGLKVLLEEGARGFRILRPQVGGLAADVRQRGGELCALVRVLSLEHGSAACLIGSESGEMIVGRPARELAPFDGLELAAREFQRPFGECAGGRETDDRAKQACEDPAPRRAHRPLRKLATSLDANKCAADRNGAAARASVFVGAVERYCRAGARYHDAAKKRKSFACNLSAGRALISSGR